MAKLPYHLTDPVRLARLKELVGIENPTDLEAELGIARLLQEEALESGNSEFAAQLLKIIGKLAATSEVARFRRGELLAKSAVLDLARKMVEALTASIAGRFEGWELALESVQDQILKMANEVQNPDQLNHTAMPNRVLDVEALEAPDEESE